MTLVTLVGIFITSFLIGTISNAIKDKIASLQEGRSAIIEKDHVVIIGFDENVTSIIEELALANENQKDAVVVVLAEHDKTEMEDVIRDRIDDLRGLRVICRSGRPESLKSLDVCSLDTCKSIIVNLEDDFSTVKTILACKSMGVDSTGPLMLVASACCTAFMTPMATPTVPLVMGIGGYDISSNMKQSLLPAAILSIVNIFWIMTVYPL
jgi:hypothetical protein